MPSLSIAPSRTAFFVALLAVAGVAGALYLRRHRTIKSKRPSTTRVSLPSLEALDRVNAISLVVGFLLLSLGVVTGVLWTQAVDGRLWPATAHANATLVAWLVAGRDLQFSIARMATVMVITCPHALGLAIPLVVAITTSIGANNPIRRRLPPCPLTTLLGISKSRETSW